MKAFSSIILFGHVLLFNCGQCSAILLRTAANPEAFMHPISMINFYGYPAELHQVVTADGHLLEVHRIPGSQGNFSIPVIIQHGISSSSADFLVNKPPNNFPCMLWDHGYDVWLANTRGNRYSAHHTVYHPEDSRVWDFSFDELARYDLPAVMTYVQSSTGFKRVHYIGHSQGAQSMFALLSLNPSFSENIRLFSAMAPVAAIQNTTTPFLKLRLLHPWFKFRYRNGHFPAWNPKISPHFARFCQISYSTQHLCAIVPDYFFGVNDKQRDKTRTDVYMSHAPMDIAIKNADHLMQAIDKGGFPMFDYGPEGNLMRYGVPYAPQYPLQNIENVRIALYFGQSDNLVAYGDAQFLVSSLRRDVIYDDPQFNHLDFMWGIHAKAVLWGRMIQNMKNVDLVEQMPNLEEIVIDDWLQSYEV